MFRHMPPLPGVAESLWRLSDAGVWIRIITHRLCVNWGHAVAVADTVAWLDDTGIPYRDICFLGAKPEVEADCYVDDAVPQRARAPRGRQPRDRLRRARTTRTSTAPAPRPGPRSRRS